jgi:hypothetical protein
MRIDDFGTRVAKGLRIALERYDRAQTLLMLRAYNERLIGAKGGVAMLYIWLLIVFLFLLFCAFVAVVAVFQRHQRRHALEMRGYRVAGDPNVDPRSADEP